MSSLKPPLPPLHPMPLPLWPHCLLLSHRGNWQPGRDRQAERALVAACAQQLVIAMRSCLPLQLCMQRGLDLMLCSA